MSPTNRTIEAVASAIHAHQTAQFDPELHQPGSVARVAIEAHLTALAADGYAVVKVGQVPPWMKYVRAFDRGDLKCYVLKDNAEFEYPDLCSAESDTESAMKANVACPLCGVRAHYVGRGCGNCAATQDDIDRAEPGPWSDWGD